MSEQKHTEEQWGFYTLSHDSLQDIIDELTRCVKSGKDKDFYFITEMTDESDVPTICHVGNGPKSKANAQRIVTCVNAFAGVPDPKKWMEEKLRTVSNLADGIEETIDQLEDGNIPNDDSLLAILDSFHALAVELYNAFLSIKEPSDD